MLRSSLKSVLAASAALAVWSAATPLAAQSARPARAPVSPAPPASDDAQDAADAGVRVSGVDVVARKRTYAQSYGAVVGDIQPEIQYSPAVIQSFGVSTVTELLTELAPEIRSERGRGGGAPVVLLNGRRISGFNEVRDIPTEAILRIDILPEEVSLKYGYSADQRVVNIVLRRRFHAVTAEAQGGAATEGGESSGQGELDDFRVRRDTRLNLDLKYGGASQVTDAARGIVEAPPAAGGPQPADEGQDRTLSPSTRNLTANAVLAHPLPWGVNATLNATLAASSSASLLGPLVDSPLRQMADSWSAHLGSTFNKDAGSWRLSLTGAYDHADTQTDTDITAGLAGARSQSSARSISDAANLQVLANGPLLKLPAGDLYISVKAGDTQSWQGSTSPRGGTIAAIHLSRNDANGQLNIDLPLTSRRNRVLPVLGELSLNANGAVDELSDFGALTSYGYGLNWTPVEGWNLIVSQTHDQAAPTMQQLGGAVIATPGARLYDYATGQTVVVTQISGAAPGLTADTRSVTKIGLTVKPFAKQDLTVSANYIRSVVHNPIATFPAASVAIEAAFPDRFLRDAQGELTEVDLRPVNFARSERSEIRWGIDYARPIGKQPQRIDWRAIYGARGAGGGAGGPGGRGPGGRFGGLGGGAFPTAGRLQVAVYHTLYLSDRELVRPGGPTLDLLGGAPAGGTGGQYRNEIEAQLGLTLSGFGARVSADWREGDYVQGLPGSAAGDLRFSPITTLNLRLWDNFGQQKAVLKRLPWLRGARVTLNVSNLLDERVTVRDAMGATPLGYQPGFIDPTGRTISLSIRKLFF